jgi:hemicentin
VDCNWAHWGNWGPCSNTCGSGLQVRQRGILPYTDIDGGQECNDAERKSAQACNRFACPVDCSFGSWSLWGGCSQTCGAGLKRRTRDTTPMAHGGRPCIGALFVDEKCNNFVCPVDCSWSQWGGWGVCSRTCGGGIRLRERVYANQMENGGVHCPGSPAEVLACNIEECPIDCAWAPWHDPGPCTKTCNGGSFTRHRAKITYEHFGGVPCVGPNTEIGPCNVEPCAIDCQYAEWAPFGECSASCGGGVHQTTRNGTDPFHGGMDCYAQNKSKEEECNTMPCPAIKAAAWRQTCWHSAVLLLAAAVPPLLQR